MNTEVADGRPSNFPYNIVKINSNNGFVFYCRFIWPITWTLLKPKDALSHFPALGVWDYET